MAALDFGGQFAVEATAKNLTTLLGLGERKWARRITIRLKTGATAALYAGHSNVTNVPANAHVEIGAGQEYEFFAGDNGKLSSDEIYLVGTVNAANVAFVNGMS